MNDVAVREDEPIGREHETRTGSAAFSLLADLNVDDSRTYTLGSRNDSFGISIEQ